MPSECVARVAFSESVALKRHEAVHSECTEGVCFSESVALKRGEAVTSECTGWEAFSGSAWICKAPTGAISRHVSLCNALLQLIVYQNITCSGQEKYKSLAPLYCRPMPNLLCANPKRARIRSHNNACWSRPAHAVSGGSTCLGLAGHAAGQTYQNSPRLGVDTFAVTKPNGKWIEAVPPIFHIWPACAGNLLTVLQGRPCSTPPEPTNGGYSDSHRTTFIVSSVLVYVLRYFFASLDPEREVGVF